MCLDNVLVENPSISKLRNFGVQFDKLTGYPMAFKLFDLEPSLKDDHLQFPYGDNGSPIKFLTWLNEYDFRWNKYCSQINSHYKTGFHSYVKRNQLCECVSEEVLIPVLLRNIHTIGYQSGEKVLVSKYMMMLPPTDSRKLKWCLYAF